MASNLQFGVFLPSYAFQAVKSSMFDRVRETVLECEQLGYDSVWLDDHLMYGKSQLLECWTALSALSTVTSKIRLGTMVTCSGFRNPAVLAKMAATLDVISKGRLELGIGAGVQKQEHLAYGLPFPEAHTRIERLNESIEIMKKLWTQEKTSYKGKHHYINDAICEPKPMRKPHPPIIVGGSGEKLTLKITARHANRFDFGYLPSIELYKHKLQALQSHCKMVGRNFREIEKSCWPAGQILLSQNPKDAESKFLRLKPKNVSREDFEKISFVGTPDKYVQTMQTYVDLGVTYFMLFFGDLPDTSSLRLFAETVLTKT